MTELTHNEVARKGGNTIKAMIKRGELPADHFSRLAKKGAKKRWPASRKRPTKGKA